MPSTATLQEVRDDFAQNRMVAMPIAGTIGWTVAGILGALLPVKQAALAMFICVGMIFYLGILVGHLTGEPIVGAKAKKSELDPLFMLTIVMACLVFAIAIPFYFIEPTSVPLSVGILSGLMWVPLSWMMQHWIGLFHGISRTVLVLVAWYLFPEDRFVVISGVIVVIYLISIYVLLTRKRPAVAPAGLG